MNPSRPDGTVNHDNPKPGAGDSAGEDGEVGGEGRSPSSGSGGDGGDDNDRTAGHDHDAATPSRQ